MTPLGDGLIKANAVGGLEAWHDGLKVCVVDIHYGSPVTRALGVLASAPSHASTVTMQRGGGVHAVPSSRRRAQVSPALNSHDGRQVPEGFLHAERHRWSAR